MRKQTKLVAVLSAAALLAVGASMTSFAAGWTEENGTWVYYDSDDELVTNEWKKSGSNYYYLDDNGEMLTESWVDDDYYVDETGKMVTNQWEKLTNEDADYSDPDDDGEAWYYFDSKGKKVSDKKKTINGKVYYFDGDGKMEDGWYEEDDSFYYLGGEDDGARKSGWLWLEKPDSDTDDVDLCDDDECANCDDEGWYWFAKDGKLYKADANKKSQKKIDGKYYYFNEHGQMLYNWIVATNDDAALKDNEDQEFDGKGSIEDTRYAFNVDKGWRVDGWLKLDGSYYTGAESDEDWYFFDEGKADNAFEDGKDVIGRLNDSKEGGYGLEKPRVLAKIKEEGKYFAFNELGQMQDGLQAIADDDADFGYDVFYFDENGFMKTGKINNVEEDDGDVESYYFETSNSHKGRGVTGEENGYLYFKGKRLEADDDYKIFAVPSKVTKKDDGYSVDSYDLYLVNENGKIQKGTSGKKITDGKVENFNYELVENKLGDDADDDDKDVLYVTTNSDGKIQFVSVDKKATDEKTIFTKENWNKVNNLKDSITKAPEDVDFGWED